VHYVLLLLQLLLDRLIPTWRDGLTMAARADGRIEQIPARPDWWDRCVNWFSRDASTVRCRRQKVRAVHGDGALPPDVVEETAAATTKASKP
jgi:hypothetical protein